MRYSLVLISFLSCTREGPKDASAAMRAIDVPSFADDRGYDGALDAIRHQAQWLRKIGKPLRFGPDVVPASAYADALEALAETLAQGDAKRTTRFLAERFKGYEVFGKDDWGEVKLTAYFEPILKGSRERSAQFSDPILRRPDDLLTISTGEYWEPIVAIGTMRGRLDPRKKDRIVPYFSRREINEGALDHKALAIAYLDPVDSFFMHIQGSGSVELPDGSLLRVGYADQNGHPYSAIGQHLRDVIPPEKMGMTAIADHLRGLLPTARHELLAKNPSYIFFAERTGPAMTSNTTPVVDGRTIATDARFFPKGAIALLTFTPPSTDGTAKAVTRLVIDQDTGGAIKGGGRVDLFWGRGVEAGRIAGEINQTATLTYLAPR